MDLTFWVSATLAAIFVGLGKGGLPVMATLAVPSLSLVMSPIAAAGLLLPVYIVSDVFALFAYRRDYNSKVLKIAFVGMTLGVIVGAFTAHMIIEWVITFLIGSMGAIFALRMLLQKQSIPSDERVAIKVSQGVFWTTIAGFTSFISHNGGPPWQIFTLRLNLPKSVFVGTSVIAFSYVNFIKLFPYVWLGQIDYESTYVSLYLMLPASLAVFIGVKAVKVIPEPVFYNFVTWALLLISIKLMFDGIYIGLLVD